jgi:hypothetical protein
VTVAELKARLAQQQDRFVVAWVTATFDTYEPPTARFLCDVRDPFRNPVGRAVRDGLWRLTNELLGSFDEDRAAAALAWIVRIRTVQDFAPDAALAFVGFARQAVRATLGPEADEPQWIEARAAFDAEVGQLERLAGRLHADCVRRLAAIRSGEARRRHYLEDRMRASRRVP